MPAAPAPAREQPRVRGDDDSESYGSVTTCVTIARHHRDRCRKQTGTGALYWATVDRDAVLALFNTRGEHEVVIDPDRLGHIHPLTVDHMADYPE